MIATLDWRDVGICLICFGLFYIGWLLLFWQIKQMIQEELESEIERIKKGNHDPTDKH